MSTISRLNAVIGRFPDLCVRPQAHLVPVPVHVSEGRRVAPLPAAGWVTPRGFLMDDRGSPTVEFTALVPFFLTLMVLLLDASTVYLTHSEMYAAARDVSRKMSVESVTTPDAARVFASRRLHLGDRTYTVDPRFGGDMVVTISIPLRDAVIFGALLTRVLGRQISATASTRREPFG